MEGAGYTIARSNGSCWWPVRDEVGGTTRYDSSLEAAVFPANGGFEYALKAAVDDGLELNDNETVIMQYVGANGRRGGMAVLRVSSRVLVKTSVQRLYQFDDAVTRVTIRGVRDDACPDPDTNDPDAIRKMTVAL